MRRDTIHFVQSIYQSDQAIRGVDYFEHYADENLRITLPVKDHLYGLVMNLGPSSDSYWVNEHEHQIPDGYFNILSLTPNSTHWAFKEGQSCMLMITCTAQFMSILIDNYGWLKDNLPSGSTPVAGPLIPRAHVITPSMDDDIEHILSDTENDGCLRTMYLESKATNLFFSALQTSDDHRQNRVDNEIVLKIKTIYDFMTMNLEHVRGASELLEVADMPEEKFLRIFDLLYFMTPDAALERERLNAAEGLVRYSAENIFEISQRTGFISFEAFLTSFENRFGMHPSEFRTVYGIPDDQRFNL
jgi:AraC-like DNA-binding protein